MLLTNHQLLPVAPAGKTVWLFGVDPKAAIAAGLGVAAAPTRSGVTAAVGVHGGSGFTRAHVAAAQEGRDAAASG